MVKAKTGAKAGANPTTGTATATAFKLPGLKSEKKTKAQQQLAFKSAAINAAPQALSLDGIRQQIQEALRKLDSTVEKQAGSAMRTTIELEEGLSKKAEADHALTSEMLGNSESAMASAEQHHEAAKKDVKSSYHACLKTVSDDKSVADALQALQAKMSGSVEGLRAKHGLARVHA